MENRETKKLKIFGSRRVLLAAIDICCLIFAYLFSMFCVPISSTATGVPFPILLKNFTVFASCLLVSDSLFGVYNHVWRYASFTLYLRLIFANFIGGSVAFVIVWFGRISVGIWQSISLVAIATLVELFLRFIYQ